MKTCKKCCVAQPLVNYHKDAKAADGKRETCKICAKIFFKKWYELNRESNIKKSALWVTKNYQRAQETIRAWKKANPDKRRKQAALRAYREKNAPGGPFRLDRLDYDNRYQLYGGKCAYCGAYPDTMDHLKALAKGGGNWASNVVPVCKRCNTKKSTRTAWIDWPKPNIPGPSSKLP